MMAVVSPQDRSVVTGITGVAGTIGASVVPIFSGRMFSRPQLANAPFFLAGMLKIAHDLLLYQASLSIQ
jgi:nitrate/nitrite transporter NarK